MTESKPGDLAARVTELELRVAALEGRAATGEPLREDGGGLLAYEGTVTLHHELSWKILSRPEPLLGLPDAPRTEVLAALGNPVRIAVIRLLATDGPQPASALQAAAGLGSTGQLYHHLKALTGARIVEQDGRGSYRLRPQATVPVLIMLAAASDIAGQLH
ncbi:helix-turn-helix domain-containing protein [Allokutzneria sp. A3M-2-11 16]|uniref:ArsR/SmtB family transcription factor n=1 Tax=Allokutzneria sp. A3M-2-11 16 TaxID=2962043 RepID=UPI0020B89019|nr:helix-turn-helix domain-containing protein [Allokutzneria sp. A3M-2-11 16]MCP3801823.1 helix-turn-helix domain-containing protein [Allokutzneria sp. A3M-2-11 16]